MASLLLIVSRTKPGTFAYLKLVGNRIVAESVSR